MSHGPVAGQQAPIPAHYSPRLANHDLVPLKHQNWSAYNIFAMWMSDVHSVGGYVFAAGLFTLGLSGWQVLTALLVGIGLVNVLVNWMSTSGQKYGVPYAVACRATFGVFGANIPGLIKAIIAICWYGIQTWVASTALVVLALKFFPALEPLTKTDFLGLSYLGWAAFLALWSAQLVVFYRGMEAIRRFIDWAGPGVYVVMFALAGWIVWKAGWDNISFSLGSVALSAGESVWVWITAVALVVSYFSGPMLNFADFSRLGSSLKGVRRGNFLGLPLNFMAFAIVTVITTSGALTVFGEMITDPVELVARIDNLTAVVIGAATFMIATIGINIVANFISPAFDLANVAPRHISFKTGGLIASIASILVLPWHLYNNPVMVQYTLGVLGAVVGPLYGILMADFYRVNRQHIELDALYDDQPTGRYWFTGGFNLTAVYALIPSAIAACIVALVPAFKVVAPFSWFVGAIVGYVAYLALARHPKYGIEAQNRAKREVALPATAITGAA